MKMNENKVLIYQCIDGNPEFYSYLIVKRP